MLPSSVLHGVHAVRDTTLTDSGLVQRPERTTDGRGGQNTTWTTVGTYSCRVDPMNSGVSGSGQIDLTKRMFGLTFPASCPVLSIGYRVTIDAKVYLIEKAHDGLNELIIRRYEASIIESDWIGGA